MSTPEEVERERASLIALSEEVRLALRQVKEMRAVQLPWFEEALAKLRETNASPAMQALDEASLAEDPDQDPRQVEKALEGFIGRMSAQLEGSQRSIEATWLGIEEAIIALEETGQVPGPSKPGTKLLPELPPRPGPDDEM